MSQSDVDWSLHDQHVPHVLVTVQPASGADLQLLPRQHQVARNGLAAKIGDRLSSEKVDMRAKTLRDGLILLPNMFDFQFII